MTTKGYYSLLQFCPDDSRLETVNIGLVVFCPEIPRVLVRWASDISRRARKLVGTQDWALLERQKLAIEARLRCADEFRSGEAIRGFVDSRAGAVRLTPARSLKLVNDVEQLFGALFSRLVMEPATPGRAPRVVSDLRRALASAGVDRLLQKHITVTVPKINKPLKAEYGYQNGRFNLIKPEQFALSTDDQMLRKASLVAVEGQYLYDQPDATFHQMRLVLVANFGAGNGARAELVRDIMERHKVTLYTFENLGPLVDDIKVSAARLGGRLPIPHEIV